MNETASSAATIPQLSEIEARVLGCLVEKALTTPDQYPLTANAAMVAANQKTAREPVMELELGAVGHALRTLEDKKLVRVQLYNSRNEMQDIMVRDISARGLSAVARDNAPAMGEVVTVQLPDKSSLWGIVRWVEDQ